MTTLAIGTVGVPVFEITGLSSSQLVAAGLPTDGSLVLAFLENGSGGTFASTDRRLVAFNGQGGDSVSHSFVPTVGSQQDVWPPSGWAFCS